jgi:hypothetical protein
MNWYNAGGPPGTEVTATGSGWEAGHEVNVQWNATRLTSATVDDNGDFTVSFTVPEDAAEGQHTVYFLIYIPRTNILTSLSSSRLQLILNHLRLKPSQPSRLIPPKAPLVQR